MQEGAKLIAEFLEAVAAIPDGEPDEAVKKIEGLFEGIRKHGNSYITELLQLQ